MIKDGRKLFSVNHSNYTIASRRYAVTLTLPQSKPLGEAITVSVMGPPAREGIRVETLGDLIVFRGLEHSPIFRSVN